MCHNGKSPALATPQYSHMDSIVGLIIPDPRKYYVYYISFLLIEKIEKGFSNNSPKLV